MYKARPSHGVLIYNPNYTVYEFREWENKVLRIIFGLQYKKVKGTRKKLHSVELRVTLHPLGFFFLSLGATTPIGGCILQPSSGL